MEIYLKFRYSILQMEQGPAGKTAGPCPLYF